jgi:hypothetical protein
VSPKLERIQPSNRVVPQEAEDNLQELQVGVKASGEPDTNASQNDISNAWREAHRVETVQQAEELCCRLYANPQAYVACDTEVHDIDVTEEGPVGNGYVICVSLYAGPDVDLGGGPGKAVWVDATIPNVLIVLKVWFQDSQYKKVWHNYAFDRYASGFAVAIVVSVAHVRHVLHNPPFEIDCMGLAGDTMHMARLEDTSRGTISAWAGSHTQSSWCDREVHWSRKRLFSREYFRKPP